VSAFHRGAKLFFVKKMMMRYYICVLKKKEKYATWIIDLIGSNKLILFELEKKKRNKINGSNLKRKVIRITWGKKYFFKGNKQCISIHSLLNTKEQNEMKKGNKTISLN
jgi:hypothetical protein